MAVTTTTEVDIVLAGAAAVGVARGGRRCVRRHVERLSLGLACENLEC